MQPNKPFTWKPCNEPGKAVDALVLFCSDTRETCHETALKVRAGLLAEGPEVEWSVITRIIERTG